MHKTRNIPSFKEIHHSIFLLELIFHIPYQHLAYSSSFSCLSVAVQEFEQHAVQQLKVQT